MNHLRTATGDISPRLRGQIIEDFRSAFSSDWRPGVAPRIPDYLDRAPHTARGPLFRDLLAIELSFRRSRGEAPKPEDYTEAFPTFSGEVLQVFQAEGSQTAFDSLVGGDLSTESISPSPSCARAGAAPGELVGRYQLMTWIGRGGFGEVWKGFDPELNRTVAIKLARRDRDFSANALEQLLHEARRQAKLSHPGIVTVYDVARENSRLHIVSEYIEGQTLRFRMKSGKISLDEIVSIVSQVARALHHAHTHDLVHRDVKPGNILLRTNGEAVVTDFGLAISEREQLAERSMTLGTWPYMSPEQARGESNCVDARTDVYSLGVVLFELLTGRYPYPAETQREYAQQVIHRPPRPPRTIDDSIPEELERICLCCLAKSVEDRFTTCRDLADALTRWQVARPEGPTPRAGNQLPGRGGLLKFAVLTAVLIGLIPLAVSYLPRKPSEPVGVQPVLDSTWTALLDQEPAIFSWEAGDGSEPPRFDPLGRRYAVRSDRVRWIARCREIECRPFMLRGVIAVDDWLGVGGFVWGLQRDEAAFPEKGFRCFSVEYCRSEPDQSPRLVLMELTMTEVNFRDIRVTRSRCIDELDVPRPAHTEAPLELDVAADGVRIRFDQQIDWEPADSRTKTNWLPEGTSAVGLTGWSHDVAIRDFAIQYLPLDKERTP